MKMDSHELRGFLNYDTHTRQFLSYQQRLELHKAISKTMNYWRHVVSDELHQKLLKVKKHMKDSGWEPTIGVYKEDKTTSKIEFIISNNDNN